MLLWPQDKLLPLNGAGVMRVTLPSQLANRCMLPR
jgi:hypothetical protein